MIIITNYCILYSGLIIDMLHYLIYYFAIKLTNYFEFNLDYKIMVVIINCWHYHFSIGLIHYSIYYFIIIIIIVIIKATYFSFNFDSKIAIAIIKFFNLHFNFIKDYHYYILYSNLKFPHFIIYLPKHYLYSRIFF